MVFQFSGSYVNKQFRRNFLRVLSQAVRSLKHVICLHDCICQLDCGVCSDMSQQQQRVSFKVFWRHDYSFTWKSDIRCPVLSYFVLESSCLVVIAVRCCHQFDGITIILGNVNILPFSTWIYWLFQESVSTFRRWRSTIEHYVQFDKNWCTFPYLLDGLINSNYRQDSRKNSPAILLGVEKSSENDTMKFNWCVLDMWRL